MYMPAYRNTEEGMRSSTQHTVYTAARSSQVNGDARKTVTPETETEATSQNCSRALQPPAETKTKTKTKTKNTFFKKCVETAKKRTCLKPAQ
jgi:hypothetical protein